MKQHFKITYKLIFIRAQFNGSQLSSLRLWFLIQNQLKKTHNNKHKQAQMTSSFIRIIKKQSKVLNERLSKFNLSEIKITN